jgi:hypothetical protein
MLDDLVAVDRLTVSHKEAVLLELEKWCTTPTLMTTSPSQDIPYIAFNNWLLSFLNQYLCTGRIPLPRKKLHMVQTHHPTGRRQLGTNYSTFTPRGLSIKSLPNQGNRPTRLPALGISSSFSPSEGLTEDPKIGLNPSIEPNSPRQLLSLSVDSRDFIPKNSKREHFVSFL